MTEVKPPFGPGSVTWEVLRQPVFLLGGMRALLLQIAEPKVAAGVAEHSDFANRLFPRLQHTIDVMVEVGLGTPEESKRALTEMNRAHVGVNGTMPDGSSYDAQSSDLKLWVLSTLISSVLVTEERYLGEFDEATRRRYYRESREIARLMGIPNPPFDLAEFRAYVDRRLEEVEVTEQARRIAHHVLYPQFGPIPPAAFAPLRVVTAEMLPARLRDGFGLTLSPRQRKWVGRAQSTSRWLIPKIPQPIRTFPVLHPIRGIRYRLGHLMGRPREEGRRAYWRQSGG